MGFLLRLLKNLFGGVIKKTFHGQINNTILATATITAFIALSIGLMSAMKVIFDLIKIASPPEANWGFGFMPDNLPLCVTAVIDARLAYWVYSFKSGLLGVRSRIYKQS